MTMLYRLLLVLVLSSCCSWHHVQGEYLALSDATIHQAVQLWTSSDGEDRQAVLLTYGPIHAWNVSLVTDMNRLFRNKLDFDDDIRTWDVSRVTSMELMFYGASSFTQNLNAWDMSSVTRLGGMFVHASSYAATLCWPTLRDNLFVEAIFCGTNGASFDPCCYGMPQQYVQEACCNHGQPCPGFCATDSQPLGPTMAPTMSPSTGYFFNTGTEQPSISPTTNMPSFAPSSAPSTSSPTAAPSTMTPLTMESHVTLVGLRPLNVTPIISTDNSSVNETDLNGVENPAVVVVVNDTHADDNNTDDALHDPMVVVAVQQGDSSSSSEGTDSNSKKRLAAWLGSLGALLALVILGALLVAAKQRRQEQEREDDALLDDEDDSGDRDDADKNAMAEEEAGTGTEADDDDDDDDYYMDQEAPPPLPIAIDLVRSGTGQGAESIELSFDASYLQEQPDSRERYNQALNSSFLSAEVGADEDQEEHVDEGLGTRRKSGRISRIVVQDVVFPGR